MLLRQRLEKIKIFRVLLNYKYYYQIRIKLNVLLKLLHVDKLSHMSTGLFLIIFLEILLIRDMINYEKK